MKTPNAQENGLVRLIRIGINRAAIVGGYAFGAFAAGSLIYSLGFVSIYPNARINSYPKEHPEIIQYYNAKSDLERIVVEEENPNLSQTLKEYRQIYDDDQKCLFYMMGGFVIAMGCAGIAAVTAAVTEDKKKM